MIKKLLTALYTDNKDILYLNEDFGNVVFNCNGMSILNISLDNINLGNSFDEDDPDTLILLIIFLRLLTWGIKIEKRKALKKELNEELMPVVWHFKRW